MEWIKAHYAQNERKKVDKHKDSFFDYDQNLEESYNNETVSASPSAIKQLGRIILDTAPMKLLMPNLHKRSQQKRDREAYLIATREHQLEYRQAELDRIKEKNEYEAMRQRNNELRSEQEFLREMEVYRIKKSEEFRASRSQEISERTFNERLTKLEDIKSLAEIDDSGISKSEIDYNGRLLTVYDMRGYPFVFLQHAIDFKGRGEDINTHRIGSKTAKELQDNPALWTEQKDESFSYGGLSPDAKSNTISTSYINTIRNFRTIYSSGLLYGFDHLRPDSILQITGGDGATSNGVGESKTSLFGSRIYTPSLLEQNGVTTPYNEIQIRRYDESGQPQLPDFIIVKNGQIDKVMLEHAAFFNIPIINIETKFYEEIEANNLSELIDSVSSESDYIEIKNVLDAINSSFLRHGQQIADLPIGLDLGDAQKLKFYNDQLTKKISSFIELELSSRINYLKNFLKTEIININNATNENQRYIGIKNGYTSIKKRTHGDGWSGETMHLLDITIPVGTKKDGFSFRVYDGDNPSPNSQKIGSSNSVVYNEIEPIINEYIAAINKNKNY